MGNWTERKFKFISVTTIDPVTGWSKIAQYNDKRAISKAN